MRNSWFDRLKVVIQEGKKAQIRSELALGRREISALTQEALEAKLKGMGFELDDSAGRVTREAVAVYVHKDGRAVVLEHKKDWDPGVVKVVLWKGWS